MPWVLLCCSTRHPHRGASLTGVLLCKLAHQALKGAPWVGSYSVVQCIRSLMGQPLCCSAASAGMWRERGYGVAPPPTCDSAVSPCLHGCLAFHHDLPPHIPSIRLSAVNNSPCPGIAPQSLSSISQPLPLPGDPHSCLAYVLLWQEPSDSHSI